MRRDCRYTETMCGIAGFVTTAPASGSEAVLERMTDAIRHRGPDDSGFYHDEWAHLGHRRLSIIDIAGGHQPIANESGTCWITYNGEIFNHAELRPALEQAGHRYTSRSDTETILHAYEEHGPRSLEHFRGMFAFAIWDSAQRRLFCARDRLGIKPFYYFWDGQVFAFASEIKGAAGAPRDFACARIRAGSRVSGVRLFERRSNLVSEHPQADAGSFSGAGLG